MSTAINMAANPGFTMTGNVILGNYIGADASGTGVIPNGFHGINMFATGAGGFVTNTTIGGTAAGAGNVIAGNAHIGVFVGSAATGTAIRGNSIVGNGEIGIDLLGNVGPTANDVDDGDTGANNLQNFPVLTQAAVASGTITIDGTLNSAASSAFDLDFFASPACDASGWGEGAVFLGTAPVTTDGSGNVGFSKAFTLPAGAGPVVTATATDAAGNTSEFSACSGGPVGSVVPVVLTNFSGSETVEPFDPNFGRLNSPVVFHGVTYTSLAGGQLWSDVNWAANGFYTNLPTASAGFGLNDVVGLTQLQIDFSTPVSRVGVFAATSPITTFIMTAYDDNLVAMGSVSATMPAAARAAFVGLQATANIKRIIITEPSDNGQISIFDDLRYESVVTASPAAAAQIARHYHTATTLTDGRVLVAEEFDDTEALASIIHRNIQLSRER